MAFRIEFLRSAARELEALPQPMRRRVGRAIGGLAVDLRPPGAKLLSGEDRRWRVRVGDYRILYRIHDDVVLVVIVRVSHRSDAYR
jgi:mRNA interferase RelE/StbE